MCDANKNITNLLSNARSTVAILGVGFSKLLTNSISWETPDRYRKRHFYSSLVYVWVGRWGCLFLLILLYTLQTRL